MPTQFVSKHYAAISHICILMSNFLYSRSFSFHTQKINNSSDELNQLKVSCCSLALFLLQIHVHLSTVIECTVDEIDGIL